jgi:hypothetical protein
MSAIRSPQPAAALRYGFLWLAPPTDGGSLGSLPALSGSFSLMLHGEDHWASTALRNG